MNKKKKIYKLKKFRNHFIPVQRRSQKIVTEEDENKKITGLTRSCKIFCKVEYTAYEHHFEMC